jgi:hypothetical protein
MHQDPMGFTLALHQDLRVRGETGQGQMWFDDGDDVRMIVVPGRDTAEEYGTDVTTYQRDSEPELKPYREGQWTAVAGLSTYEVNGSPAVEAEFTWTQSNRQYFGRNFAMLQDGRYHTIFVYGPDRDRSDISLFFEKAAETYRYTK